MPDPEQAQDHVQGADGVLSKHATPPAGITAGGWFNSMKFIVKVNGKKHLNGEVYGVALTGAVDKAPRRKNVSIYQLAAHVCSTIAEHNKEMEYPETFQVTVGKF